MHEFRVDFMRFTSSGLGPVFGPEASALTPGERVIVFDDGADAIEAEVVAVSEGSAEVRVCWGAAGQDVTEQAAG